MTSRVLVGEDNPKRLEVVVGRTGRLGAPQPNVPGCTLGIQFSQDLPGGGGG